MAAVDMVVAAAVAAERISAAVAPALAEAALAWEAWGERVMVVSVAGQWRLHEASEG
jgi:hypothetical protein